MYANVLWYAQRATYTATAAESHTAVTVTQYIVTRAPRAKDGVLNGMRRLRTFTALKNVLAALDQPYRGLIASASTCGKQRLIRHRARICLQTQCHSTTYTMSHCQMKKNTTAATTTATYYGETHSSCR